MHDTALLSTPGPSVLRDAPAAPFQADDSINRQHLLVRQSPRLHKTVSIQADKLDSTGRSAGSYRVARTPSPKRYASSLTPKTSNRASHHSYVSATPSQAKLAMHLPMSPPASRPMRNKDDSKCMSVQRDKGQRGTVHFDEASVHKYDGIEDVIAVEDKSPSKRYSQIIEVQETQVMPKETQGASTAASILPTWLPTPASLPRVRRVSKAAVTGAARVLFPSANSEESSSALDPARQEENLAPKSIRLISRSGSMPSSPMSTKQDPLHSSTPPQIDSSRLILSSTVHSPRKSARRQIQEPMPPRPYDQQADPFARMAFDLDDARDRDTASSNLLCTTPPPPKVLHSDMSTRTPSHHHLSKTHRLRREKGQAKIDIYTDCKDQIPELDQSSENPFLTRPVTLSPQPEPIKRNVSRAFRSEDSTRSSINMLDPFHGGDLTTLPSSFSPTHPKNKAVHSDPIIEEAVKRGQGMYYVFRGRKVYREFSRSETSGSQQSLLANGRESLHNDTPAQSRDGHQNQLLPQDSDVPRHFTRASIKPRLLFPSPQQEADRAAAAAAALEAEEALTDIEDWSMVDPKVDGEREDEEKNSDVDDKYHQTHDDRNAHKANTKHGLPIPLTPIVKMSAQGPVTPPTTVRATRASARLADLQSSSKPSSIGGIDDAKYKSHASDSTVEIQVHTPATTEMSSPQGRRRRSAYDPMPGTESHDMRTEAHDVLTTPTQSTASKPCVQIPNAELMNPEKSRAKETRRASKRVNPPLYSDTSLEPETGAGSRGKRARAEI